MMDYQGFWLGFVLLFGVLSVVFGAGGGLVWARRPLGSPGPARRGWHGALCLCCRCSALSRVTVGRSLLKTLSTAGISDFLSQGLESGIDVRVAPFG